MSDCKKIIFCKLCNNTFRQYKTNNEFCNKCKIINEKCYFCGDNFKINKCLFYKNMKCKNCFDLEMKLYNNKSNICNNNYCICGIEINNNSTCYECNIKSKNNLQIINTNEYNIEFE